MKLIFPRVNFPEWVEEVCMAVVSTLQNGKESDERMDSQSYLISCPTTKALSGQQTADNGYEFLDEKSIPFVRQKR